MQAHRPEYDFRHPRTDRPAPTLHYIHHTHPDLERLVQGLGSVVAFDLEWAHQGTVDIIALADVNTILLIQVTGCHPDELPCAVRELMEDGSRRKVGQAILGDAILLGTIFDVVAKHLIDLSELAKSVHGDRWPNRGKAAISLQLLCEVYVERLLAKDTSIRCGHWDQPLAPQQVHYAACDAFASIEIYFVLEHIRQQREATVPTNYADFCFNCDRRVLDEASDRRANKALADFQMHKQQAPKPHQSRVNVDGFPTGDAHATMWEGRVTLDGAVIATARDSRKQTAKGKAAKVAMACQEWLTWFDAAHSPNTNV